MARIHLKGQKEPISVSNESAEKAKALWLHYLQTKQSTTISIGSIMTTASEIKSIITDADLNKKEKIFPREELLALEKEIEPYKVEKDGNRYFSVEAEKKYLRDKGIFSKNNEIVEYKISEYQEFDKKLSALWEMNSKKDYAQKMETIEYEKVASSMPDIPQEEIPF